MASSPFIDASGEPRLVDSAVLYFDLLGVSAMAQGERAEGELKRMDRTIRDALPYPLGAPVEDGDGAYPVSVFSDSLVQVVPIYEELTAVDAIFAVVLEVAQLQTKLATNDYFARGAITLGKFHSHEGLLFGPALVEAVSLEREVADVPRIALSPAASAALLSHDATSREGSPDHDDLPVLVDEDGVAFVDYLTGTLQSDPEIDLAVTLGNHRDVVVEQLKRQRSDFGRWSKHRWVAEYHNATCRRYRDLLEGGGGLTALLVDSIHTDRQYSPLARVRA